MQPVGSFPLMPELVLIKERIINITVFLLFNREYFYGSKVAKRLN
jgi:hypothetical protein